MLCVLCLYITGYAPQIPERAGVTKLRLLFLTKLALVVCAALVIGYWSGVEEWRYYERFADLPSGETKELAMQRWEKPVEPEPVWVTMLQAAGILVLIAAAYEAASFLVAGAVSRLKRRRGA